MSNTFNESVESLFNKMEGFITTKTVVGEAINIGGVIIVPLVDVMFGIGAGVSELSKKETDPKANSAGAMGGKITPSAVLVIINGSVQLVDIKNKDSVNKLIDLVPGVISKLNLGEIFSKKESSLEPESDKI